MNTYLSSTEVMAFAKIHGDELVRQADLVNGGYSVNDYPIKKRESSLLLGKFSGMSSSAAGVLQTSVGDDSRAHSRLWTKHEINGTKDVSILKFTPLHGWCAGYFQENNHFD